METTAVETALAFGQPEWLWALLVVPALALVYWHAQTKRRALITRIVAPRLREQLASGVNNTVRIFRVVLVLSIFALVIVALAKPRLGYIQREIKTTGRDVIMAFDVSRSMLATDVPPTRLARAKLVALDLARMLSGDRVGVIAFAGSAFLQAPLTLDRNAIFSSIEELDTDLIPRGGTNIGAAIQTAIDAFGKAEGVVRALVVLTDGEELDADGLAVAKRAEQEGIRIFTVGIGSEEGSLIPIQTIDGRRDFVRDSAGEPVLTKLDVARLTEIAEITGGFYTPLNPDAAQLIFTNGIEPLEQVETGVLASRQPVEQYQWPLGIAMGLFVIWMLVGEGRRRRGPAEARNGARTTVISALVFGATCFDVAAQTGVEQYNAGDYQSALQAFQSDAATSPDRDKLQFNAGASAYQLGDFPGAIDYFTGALLTQDELLRNKVTYNLANALVRRGEAAKSSEARITDWKDAIKHYDDVLTREPGNQLAKENRDLVQKLLDEAEKEQDQKQDPQQQDQQQQDQQKQDQQQQDQQQQDQQQQDQQKQDQQQQDQQQQDQQQQDQQQQDQQQQDQQKQDQQKQDQQQQDQQQQDQQKQDQQKQDQQQDQQRSPQQNNDSQSAPTPQPTPGEKKEGDLQANPDASEPQGDPQDGEALEEREGEMSEAQARSLLRSMESEEDQVQFRERQQLQDVLRDW